MHIAFTQRHGIQYNNKRKYFEWSKKEETEKKMKNVLENII